MPLIKSNMLEAGNCRVHILEAGTRGDQALIFLHGMSFQAATWQDLGTLEYFAGLGYHAVALDLPGFGKSPDSPLDVTQVLGNLLEALDLDGAILIGPSMGGAVALNFSFYHQERLKALVLIGAVGIPENLYRLAEIHLPILAIWGSADTISPVTNSDLLLDNIEGVERIIIDGAPHPCYLEQPEAFHLGLTKFLFNLKNNSLP